MIPQLSKGRYLSGLHCVKRLWLEIHRPDQAAPVTAFQRHLAQQGIEVGRYAQRWFPDGVLIEIDRDDFERAAADTQAAIGRGATTIFEAAFAADGVRVIADVLTRTDEGWRLIEVKSSTRVKDDFLHDVAVQRFVIETSGLPIAGADVMVINTDCRYPHLDDLFRVEDVSQKTQTLLPDVPRFVGEFRRLIQYSEPPEVEIGNHCNSPYECPFKSVCWSHVDGERPLVFDIPRLTAQKKESLARQGVLFVDDLPKNFPLTANQQAYVERVANGHREVDEQAVKLKLSQLEYPLYFLDFETCAPAIPCFHGMKPYEQLPFQFSCHRLDEDGALTHSDFLHTSTDDPRPALTAALLDCVGETGSIVAYGAAFERGVINHLAQQFPAASQRLLALSERIWDQIEIFNNHYKHAAFGNSTSLKRVLPVLAPRLSYNNLNVRNGAEAQSVWTQMIQTPPGPEKNAVIEDLKTYCHLDTLAMVEIHRVLAQYQS